MKVSWRSTLTCWISNIISHYQQRIELTLIPNKFWHFLKSSHSQPHILCPEVMQPANFRTMILIHCWLLVKTSINISLQKRAYLDVTSMFASEVLPRSMRTTDVRSRINKLWGWKEIKTMVQLPTEQRLTLNGIWGEGSETPHVARFFRENNAYDFLTMLLKFYWLNFQKVFKAIGFTGSVTWPLFVSC